jgi:hypothetical protein
MAFWAKIGRLNPRFFPLVQHKPITRFVPQKTRRKNPPKMDFLADEMLKY